MLILPVSSETTIAIASDISEIPSAARWRVPNRLDKLGFIDPDITVDVVKDEKLIEKKNIDLPEKIINVAKELLDIHYPGQFDYIQGDAFGVHKKPHPDMIKNIRKHYKVTKEEILYVGDTNVDEETAHNADVDYVLVTYGYRTTEEIKNSCVCTNLVDTPEELLDFIRKAI